MAFMHIYHSLKIQYEVTGSPKLDDDACEAIKQALDQFRNLNVNLTSKENYQSYIFSKPLDMKSKSLVLVQLLHLLEVRGWHLVAGRTIHDEEGMVFRKSPTNTKNCNDVNSNPTDHSESEENEPTKH